MPVVPIEDDYVKHHIGVQRIASGTVAKTDKLFEELNTRLKIIVQLNRSVILFPSKSKLKSLLEQLRAAVRDTYAQVEPLVLEDLHAFVDYESDFQSRLLQRRLGIPIAPLKPARIKAIAHHAKIGARRAIGRLPAFDGVTVHQVLRDQEARLNKQLKKSVMLAIVAERAKQRASK